MNAKKKKSNEAENQITIDFLELDHMRLSVVDFAKRRKWKKGFRKTAYWEESGFYIGRGVQRFFFKDLKAPNQAQIAILANELCKEYGDAKYRFFVTGMSIIIHLRGSVNNIDDPHMVEFKNHGPKPLKVVK